MYIYFLILILIFGSYLLIDKTNIFRFNKRNLTFIIVAGIILILFSSIRADSVGSDLSLYYKIFDSTKNYTFYDIFISLFQSKKFLSVPVYNGEYEIGYILFTKLISIINDSLFSYNLFTSLFINIPILFFIYRHSKKLYLSVLIYILFGFYTQSYVVIRQYMALSMTLLSVHFLIENNYKKAIVFSLLSCTFHNTAIISLIFILLKYFWNSFLRYSKYIIIGLVLLSFICKPLIEYLILNFYPFYDDIIISGEGLKLFLFLLLITISLVMIMKREGKTKEDTEFCFILFLLGTIVQLYTLNFSLLNRLALYFQFYIVIIIPNTLELYSFDQLPEKRIVTLCYIIVLLCFFIFNLIVNDSGSVRNYKIANNNIVEVSGIQLDRKESVYENNVVY
ncbi:EpsG family protein [uncultured Traorella sp.]|uniref:EpsG family protein n=1 Tax=uncultured Traorella sp. TaxID=1929048 RepID=UPI0025DAC5E1|nr:EpsG family protein [uncultured Traorella sp.]